MSKFEQSLEQLTQIEPNTDPVKLKVLKKSLKKRFENFTEEVGHEDYVEDSLLDTVKKTPNEYIEKGIKNEIH